MARCGVPEDTKRCPDCGERLHYEVATRSYLHMLRSGCPATTNMHRHHTFVDHADADHDHGACSEHAHWAGGYHPIGTQREVSTPKNDPLGWPRNDIAEGNVWPEAVGS